MIVKLYNWRMKKLQKRQMEKRLTAQEKQQQKFHLQMRELYGFVRWLNQKGLPNRKARKRFYKDLVDNKPILENTIKGLVYRYAPKTYDPKKDYYAKIVNVKMEIQRLEQDLRDLEIAQKKADEEQKKKEEQEKQTEDLNKDLEDNNERPLGRERTKEEHTNSR
jgi:hypothetical protein